MKRAKEELLSRGFSKFVDTHERNPYDYTCERDGNQYYIEVKGTQGAGSSVILTKNEVKHAQKNQRYSVAVIVHDVKVEKEGARKGTVRVCRPWTLQPSALEPLQYQWTVSGGTKGPTA